MYILKALNSYCINFCHIFSLCTFPVFIFWNRVSHENEVILKKYKSDKIK